MSPDPILLSLDYAAHVEHFFGPDGDGYRLVMLDGAEFIVDTSNAHNAAELQQHKERVRQLHDW